MPHSSELYADFQLTVDNCEQEPIHRPKAIEGHGHLFVWDTRRKQIIACSENLRQILGFSPQEVWEGSSVEKLPDEIRQLLQKQPTEDVLKPQTIHLAGQTYCLIGHMQGQNLILELEPPESKPAREEIRLPQLNWLTKKWELSDSIEQLSDQICEAIKSLTHFDRVMVYYFDEDWNGEVIAERKEDFLEPFKGLHYPATDIPAMARKLFLANGIRTIPNVEQSPVLLHIHPALPKKEYIDLSLSQLRATSPIHIEYLQNMGVSASFTVALKLKGQLWGLIACHHYSGPLFLEYGFRRTCELIASLASNEILRLENEQASRESQAFREAEKKLRRLLEQSSEETELADILSAQMPL
ncbi:MAG: GAF domain-containing protein, partial [Bacteroidota bacterium]